MINTMGEVASSSAQRSTLLSRRWRERRRSVSGVSSSKHSKLSAGAYCCAKGIEPLLDCSPGQGRVGGSLRCRANYLDRRSSRGGIQFLMVGVLGVSSIFFSL